MAVASRILILSMIAAIFAQRTSAQTAQQTVVVTEPGTYELADLFKKADTVALVKVVSGDTEAYRVPIYKTEVIKSFKGASPGEIVYLGPYVGTRLGWEYVVFLRKVSKTITPKAVGCWLRNHSLLGNFRRRVYLDGDFLRMHL